MAPDLLIPAPSSPPSQMAVALKVRGPQPPAWSAGEYCHRGLVLSCCMPAKAAHTPKPPSYSFLRLITDCVDHTLEACYCGESRKTGYTYGINCRGDQSNQGQIDTGFKMMPWRDSGPEGL